MTGLLNVSEVDSLISSDSVTTTTPLKNGITMNESTTSSTAASRGGDFNKRHQSDSSTSSMEHKEEPRNRFFSADHVEYKKKVKNLLKLSLMNSPKSPLHSSSMNNSSLLDSVFLEAKWISEKLGNRSFEDINNISQQLITDTSNVSTDADLEQLTISFLEKHPLSPRQDSTEESKIANIQKTLNRIKMEEVDIYEKSNGHVKVEAISPVSKSHTPEKKSDDVAVNAMLKTITNLCKDNNNDEAKKQLQKLYEMLSEKPQTLQVQPIVRQDTFDIDRTTGKRKYLSNNNKSHKGDGDNSNNDILEQLSKLIGANNIDVSSMNLSGGSGNGADTKIVLIMPKMPSPVATPVKPNNPTRRSVSLSLPKKPQSALKAIENKKLSTPMKQLAPSTAFSRRSSFTGPRVLPKNPYEQKTYGGVRKSLMPSMDKTPIKQKPRENVKLSPPLNKPLPSSIRRTVSYKAPGTSAVPAVKLITATPTKTRPFTTATPSKLSLESKLISTPANPSKRLSMNPTASRLASSRLSTITRSVVTAPKSSSVHNGNNSRPALKKTEFKTPYNSKKSSEV